MIYVALAINLSTFLKKNTDAVGVATALLYFAMLFYAWSVLNGFNTRFITKDIFSTVIYGIFSLAVLSMSIFVLDGFDTRFEFALSQMVTRVCLTILYSQVYFTVPRAKKFALYAIAGNAVSSIVFLISAFTPPASIPINVEHTAERFGLFVMLMLGESIIALVTEESGLDTRDDLLIVGFGFVNVMAFKSIYYGAQPREPKHHALRRGSRHGRAFVQLHLLIGASLVGVGTGLKKIKSKAEKKIVDKSAYALFVFCNVLFVVSVNIVRLLHGFHKRSPWVWGGRIAMILIMIIFPSTSRSLSPAETTVVFACLTVMMALTDVILAPSGTSDQVEDGGKRTSFLNKAPLPSKDAKVRDLINSKAVWIERRQASHLDSKGVKGPNGIPSPHGDSHKHSDSVEIRVLARHTKSRHLERTFTIRDVCKV
ncbi:hypothetical protein AAMO2058_001428500 [Amorphochlora amoebiformis]